MKTTTRVFSLNNKHMLLSSNQVHLEITSPIYLYSIGIYLPIELRLSVYHVYMSYHSNIRTTKQSEGQKSVKTYMFNVSFFNKSKKTKKSYIRWDICKSDV